MCQGPFPPIISLKNIKINLIIGVPWPSHRVFPHTKLYFFHSLCVFMEGEHPAQGTPIIELISDFKVYLEGFLCESP